MWFTEMMMMVVLAEAAAVAAATSKFNINNDVQYLYILFGNVVDGFSLQFSSVQKE